MLREAIVVVLGADFKIETMVDPGPPRPPRRVRRRPPSRLRPAGAPPPSPGDPRAREQARQSIRPTREDRGPAATGPDERDEVVSRDDDDLDDGAESHRDLLTRHLGAEIIAEEDAPA